jgi:uncharacterized membrane protein
MQLRLMTTKQMTAQAKSSTAGASPVNTPNPKVTNAKLIAKVVIKATIMTALVFLLLCFVISLVLGGLWNPFPYLYKLDVVIVNNDNGIVGSFMTNNLSMYSPYSVRSVNTTDPEGYIGDARSWFLLRIPSGFSDRLLGALNGTVDPYVGDIDMLVDEGRSYLVLAILEPILKDAVKEASDEMMKTILANTTLSKVRDVNVLLNPVTIRSVIIHPNTYFGQDIATGFINVFIFILSVVVTMLTTHAYYTGLYGKIDFVSFYFIKQLHNCFNAIVLSATVTVALLCFSCTFYTSAGLYFLFYWLTILTVIQVIELAIHIFKQFTILFALAFLVLNFSTSSALVMLEIQHPFFQFGNGLLMYNVVNGARYLMFGSDPRIGLYVGVLIIWMVLCWLANLLFYIFFSYSVYRKKRKAAEETEDKTAGGVVSQDIQDIEGDIERDIAEKFEHNVELKEQP